MRRFLTIIGILLSNFTLHAQNPYELLWEIRHPQLQQPSYLFGTMHVNDERVFDLPDSVIIAIQSVQGMAFEADFDSASYLTFEYLMRDGEYTLDDLDLIQSRLSSSPFENNLEEIRQRPGEFFSEIIEAAKTEENTTSSILFLDAYLYRLGRELNKTITGLESFEDQFKLLYGDDDKLWGKGSGKERVRAGELKAAYLRGDTRLMGTWLDDLSLFDAYTKKLLIDDRNAVMTRGADSLMRIRPTFVAVGAAHLPGQKGIINMLKAKGYSLRPVIATQKTGKALALKAQPYEPVWQEYRNAGAGFSLQVPCKPYRATFTDLPVPMYMGMDLPGGWVYYFFSFPLDIFGGGGNSKQLLGTFMDAMTESMGEGAERTPVRQGDFVGEETLIKVEGQWMRIRIMADDRVLFAIFAGVDKPLIESPMVDHMFNSVRTFEPQRLTAREWGVRTDKEAGFSLLMPLEVMPEMESEDEYTGPGNFGKTYYIAVDERTAEEFGFYYHSVPPLHFFRSSLHEAMDELLENDFSDGQQLIESQDIFSQHMRGKHLIFETDGGHHREMLIFRRGNRSYRVSVTYTDEADSRTRMKEALASFKLLPLQHSPLDSALRTPSFSASYPTAPYREQYGADSRWGDWGADSSITWDARDPATGFSYSVSQVFFPEWIRFDTLDKVLKSMAEEGTEQSPFYSESLTLPNTTAAWEAINYRAEGPVHQYNRIILHGNHLYQIYCDRDSLNPGQAKKFLESIRFSPTPAFDWTASKLPLLLQALTSPDSATFENARRGLGYHPLSPADYTLTFDFLRRRAALQDTNQYISTLFDILAAAGDPSYPDSLDRLLPRFAYSPYLQIHSLSALVAEDRPKQTDQAIRLLKKHLPQSNDPSFKDEFRLTLSIQLYFEDKPIPHYHQLAFLLDHPLYVPDFLDYTNSIRLRGGDDLKEIVRYRDRFQTIAQDWIANPRYEDRQTKTLSADYQNLIDALIYADPDKRSFELLDQLIQMSGPETQSHAIVQLLDAGHPVKTEQMVHVLEQPGYQYELLEWLWTNDQQKRVPKKYFKEAYLARAVMETYYRYSADQAPSVVELLEKKTIWYNGQDQILYVYRVAVPNSSTWEIAFGGPFPKRGRFAYFDFPLSGSSFEPWSPNRQATLIKEWIEEEYLEEE